MKLLQSLVLAMLLVFAVTLNAQKITWNKETVEDDNPQVQGVLGSDDSGFYLIRYKATESPYGDKPKKDMVVEKYDYSNNKLFSKNIEVIEDATKGKKMLMDMVYCLNNCLIGIGYNYHDSKNAYAVKIGKDGSIDLNNVLLGSVDPSSVESQNSLLAYNRYDFTVSNDKNQLLAYYHKAKDNKISVSVIGDAANVLWSKEIPTLYPSGKYAVVNAVLNENIVYLLVSGEAIKGKTPYSLIIYNHGSDAMKKIDISLGGVNNIQSFNVVLDNTGLLTLAGIYGNTASKDNAAGTFVISIDNSGKIVVNNAILFTTDLMAKFLSEKKVEAGEGISGMVVNKVIVTNDGSIIVGADVGSSMHYNAFHAHMLRQMEGSSAITEYYEYYDAIVAKLKSDGSVIWIKDIPKKQQMTSHSAIVEFVCSYGMFINGSSVNLIYNDHKKNDGLKEEDIEKDRDILKPSIIDGGPDYIAVILESLDMSTGNATRKTLYNGDIQKTKLTLYSTLIFQTQPGKFMLYRSDDKTEQLGQLVIQ